MDFLGVIVNLFGLPGCSGDTFVLLGHREHRLLKDRLSVELAGHKEHLVRLRLLHSGSDSIHSIQLIQLINFLMFI